MICNKSVLIIGGAGHIGSHLVDSLVSNNDVIVLDLLLHSPTYRNVKAQYIYGDVKNINEIFSENSFDFIFHFGEYARVEQSFHETDFVLKNNRCAFVEVLNFCRKGNCKLIYAGSSTKFAEQSSEYVVSPYALTKKQNTELLVEYANWHKINYAIVYFYNVYGGRENSDEQYGTVIAKWLRYCSEGRVNLPVTKPGSQRRNFTHISDVILALHYVAVSGNGDDFGIGSDEDISMLQLCEIFDRSPEMRPAVAGNRNKAELRTDKTKSLGWKPQVLIKQWIQEKLMDLK